MAIYVGFDYDSERDIVFTVDQGLLETEADVDEFVSKNRQYFRGRGKKAWVVCNIDELRIRAPTAEYYGKRVRELVDEWVLGYVRYGESAASRMTVRTASLKAKIDPNIYCTKQEAVEAIEKMRGTGE